MAKNHLKAALTDNYKVDEECIGALQSGLDALSEGLGMEGLARTFSNAASSRKTSVSEVIQLLESAPEGKVIFPENWSDIKSAILLITQRVGTRESPILQ